MFPYQSNPWRRGLSKLIGIKADRATRLLQTGTRYATKIIGDKPSFINHHYDNKNDDNDDDDEKYIYLIRHIGVQK